MMGNIRSMKKSGREPDSRDRWGRQPDVSKSVVVQRFDWMGLRRPLPLVAATILLVVVSSAAFADFLSPRDPIVQDIPNRMKPPGSEFLLGTDNFGRDVFSRVLYGSRSSLFVSITPVLVASILGTLIGAASAYLGGWVDLLLQRMVDALLGLPFLVLAVVMVVALGTSTQSVAAVIAVALLPQVVRLSRSHALSIRQENFVLAARAIGARPLEVLIRHILPRTVAPVLAYATGYIGVALIAESALGFLGLGVPPPYPSWGGMLQEGRLFLEVAPWLTVFPGFALSVTAFSFALLGDSLRDVLDPRAPIRPPLRARREVRVA